VAGFCFSDHARCRRFARHPSPIPQLGFQRVCTAPSQPVPDWRRVESFCFSDHADDARCRDSYVPLPAYFSQRPTPHTAFVENKSQTPIRPSGDRAVETPYLYFSAFQLSPIRPSFPVFTVRSAEGRKPLAMFWLIANG
jgi:hypothetical protein